MFGSSPINSTRRTTLSRTIEFQGQTYDVGASVSTEIRSFAYVPAYQYDFIRRDHGSLGLAAKLFVLDTGAKMTTTVTVNDQSQTETSSGSVIAPVPVFGPQMQWFPFSSARFALDGGFQGMYLFGYGDLYSAQAAADFSVSRHWRITTGYQLGTRFSLHGGSNEIGVRLTQKGPMAGVQASW